jgi:hypothetical protein
MRFVVTAFVVYCILGTPFLGGALNGAGFAYSENFVVFTEPQEGGHEADQAFARAVVEAAERYRAAFSHEWRIRESSLAVASRTLINVSFAKELPDEGFTWTIDRPTTGTCHNLNLLTTPERAVGNLLQHEIGHVVLYSQSLPAWLEEGICSGLDDHRKIAIRASVAAEWVRTNKWPGIGNVVNDSAKNLSRTDVTGYTTAASVTNFLLSQCGGDKQKLLRFGSHCTTQGLESALQEYYGLRDATELNVAWQQWVRKNVLATDLTSRDRP